MFGITFATKNVGDTTSVNGFMCPGTGRGRDGAESGEREAGRLLANTPPLFPLGQFVGRGGDGETEEAMDYSIGRLGPLMEESQLGNLERLGNEGRLGGIVTIGGRTTRDD
jgi:hypothetical protein